MFGEKFGQLELWKFNNLSNYKVISHFVTGRKGGVSKNELGELNLSLKVGDLQENVWENRRRLAVRMGVEPKRVIFPVQTHSTNIAIYNASNQELELEDRDAIITNIRGVLIAVMSADCVPVLLFDPVTNSVGAVHAGWKGTVGKIVTKTVLAMMKNFDTRPENIIAGIGPSICQEVYEVGEEVIEAVKEAFGSKESVMVQKERKDKAFINLWEMNKIQLLELGVPPDSIEIAGICTYKNSDHFFSARKSGNKTGRFAAGIMINPLLA